MYRISYHRVYKFIIERRFLYFFWIIIRDQEGNFGWNYPTKEEAEKDLQKYLDFKATKTDTNVSYYMFHNSKLLSGTSVKEVKKKRKLIGFL